VKTSAAHTAVIVDFMQPPRWRFETDIEVALRYASAIQQSTKDTLRDQGRASFPGNPTATVGLAARPRTCQPTPAQCQSAGKWGEITGSPSKMCGICGPHRAQQGDL
jgi:hypothetical protein